jgi:zinc transporter ZupT
MPGVIMMGSMFCLFVIEMYLNGKMGGHSHSHGGPMGFETQVAAPSRPVEPNRGPRPSRPPRYTSASEFEIEDIEYEKKMAQKDYHEKIEAYQRENPSANDKEMGVPSSEMPPWFVVFYEQYVRQRLEMVSMIRASRQLEQNDMSTKRQSVITTVPAIDSPYIDVETGEAVDPQVYRKMSMNITLLEGGILFHSVFVGMTVSITIQGFVILLVAILFHQMFEGLGLGTRIAAVPYKRGSIRPWLLVVAFGMTAPIGQAIGLAVRGSYDPNSAFGLIIVGVFNAM